MNQRLFIIDDNPGDVELVRQALNEIGAGVEITSATDGDEAFRMLHELAATRDRFPGLILLDLNLITQHGHDVLRRLKADPLLKTVPVAVYTSSQTDRDIRLSYAEGAVTCLAKPLTYEETLDLMKSVTTSWFTAADTDSRRMQ